MLEAPIEASARALPTLHLSLEPGLVHGSQPGDTFTGNATLDLFLATYPSGTPTQNRVEKSFLISPMQGGAQVTFTIDGVEFKATGGATMQAVVDSTQETQESNENNNTRNANVNVSGSCPGIAPPPPTNGGNPPGCDVEATYATPNGSTVPNNQTYTYEILFKNIGTAPCGAFKVNLSGYNGRRCSGYGSRIGGSRAWASVPGLQPGASTNARISERRTPGSGTVCIKPGFSPHSFKDDNNTNHRREKVVTYQ